jgi:hypothetical protein
MVVFTHMKSGVNRYRYDNYPVNLLISPMDVLVVPDKSDPERFGLEVTPGTVAAQAVESGLRAARAEYVKNDKPIPLDARMAVMGVRQMYANKRAAEEQSHMEGRHIQPEAVFINADETNIIVHGLELAAHATVHPEAVDRGEREERAEAALDTHIVIAKQLAEQGRALPETSSL